MTTNRFLTILILLLVSVSSFAHSGKPKYNVIIDTDGAIDDLRSITMFLAQNDIRVLAITTSQGSLSAETIAPKVSQLLSYFHHEGIPVGMGTNLNSNLPTWAEFSKNVDWANGLNTSYDKNFISAEKLIEQTIEQSNSKITLIALGSLNAYANWLQNHPDQISKIEKIVWYNNSAIADDFNFAIDPQSFETIKSSSIKLDIVGNNSDQLNINKEYVEALKTANSIYANYLVSIHETPSIFARVENEHFGYWDDLIPLYMSVPMLFESQQEGNIKKVLVNENIPASLINEGICKILESSSATNNRVFNQFPTDSLLYKKEFRSMLNETLKNYGAIEWKAICMTNEIHGHTGIYSIIGAKAGIRAMDYFNVGVNNLIIKTYSGHKPPLSCFNDGVQISTGATIGQGLIEISDTIIKTPTIVVKCNNQKVKFTLNQEISKQIQHDIQFGVKTYGLKSPLYWTYIEELAIKYWQEFDRNNLFEIAHIH